MPGASDAPLATASTEHFVPGAWRLPADLRLVVQCPQGLGGEPVGGRRPRRPAS